MCTMRVGRGWARRTAGGTRRTRPHLLPIPDHAIARALRRDDVAVFEQLVNHMHRTLALACAAHVGSQAAEDVLQEVLLKIWQQRHRFDPARAGFATWAFAIARNAAIDHRRALARRESALRTLADQAPAPPPLSEDSAIVSESCRAVRRAAGALADDQREAVFHAFWLDRSHREIASALSMPLGTVKGRVRLGMARMRLALEQEMAGVPATAPPG